jgi:hypothetical protein
MHAIALAESGGDPNIVGDNGNSPGLFQCNVNQGRGAAYLPTWRKNNPGGSIEQYIQWLKDPVNNANISAPELWQAYVDGTNHGRYGEDLAAYTSQFGQRPGPGLWDNVRPFYRNNQRVP